VLAAQGSSQHGRCTGGPACAHLAPAPICLPRWPPTGLVKRRTASSPTWQWACPPARSRPARPAAQSAMPSTTSCCALRRWVGSRPVRVMPCPLPHLTQCRRPPFISRGYPGQGELLLAGARPNSGDFGQPARTWQAYRRLKSLELRLATPLPYRNWGRTQSTRARSGATLAGDQPVVQMGEGLAADASGNEVARW